MDYKSKYLKYKVKYLKLKGGSSNNNLGSNIEPELYEQIYGKIPEVKYNTTVITKEMAEEDEALGKIYTNNEMYHIKSPCANNNLDNSNQYIDPYVNIDSYVDIDTMKVYKNPEQNVDTENNNQMNNITPIILVGLISSLLLIYFQK